METLNERIVIAEGVIEVTTQIRRLLLFKQPRTTVMPVGVTSPLGRRWGFQVLYTTEEEMVLREFHLFFVNMIGNGEFETMLSNAKQGVIEFPIWHEHLKPLKRYISGFKA